MIKAKDLNEVMFSTGYNKFNKHEEICKISNVRESKNLVTLDSTLSGIDDDYPLDIVINALNSKEWNIINIFIPAYIKLKNLFI